ncbi:hypothetical protein J4228_04605 [Candidatus Woesearchaeota archaeon]|nr:hypothetical protein [Candidatus Woesearchaeota archaeon]
MVEFRIKQEDVMVVVYLNGDNGNVVLAGGMPQYLDKYHPFVEQMKRLRCNLFVPRYMGTYESSGEFNTKNSVKSVESAIKLAKKGFGLELFGDSELKWNNERVYLYGFSYGALPSLLQEEEVDKTLLVCPFISMDYHLPNSNGENLKDTFEFLQRAYPNCYRFKANDVVEDIRKVQLPNNKERLFVVIGKNDNSIPKEEVDYLKMRYNPKIIEKKEGHSIKVEDNILIDIFNRGL